MFLNIVKTLQNVGFRRQDQFKKQRFEYYIGNLRPKTVINV